MLIFSAYILYDVSNIVRGGETNYIMATLGLFLNVYNIFISLLNILLAFMTIVFLLATATLFPFSMYAASVAGQGRPVTVTVLIALLTIGTNTFTDAVARVAIGVDRRPEEAALVDELGPEQA